MNRTHHGVRRLARAAALLAISSAACLGYAALSSPAQAASSKGCVGGGFKVLGKSGEFKGNVAAPTGRFLVQGRYAQFEVDSTTFAVYDQSFTGAANELDQTGGRFTPLYASRVPDHRGLRLTSARSGSRSRTPGSSSPAPERGCP